ncbi:unnamed protein product [Effrenium voratum]|nr:unnamed protein product [Effrenium voratum]
MTMDNVIDEASDGSVSDDSDASEATEDDDDEVRSQDSPNKDDNDDKDKGSGGDGSSSVLATVASSSSEFIDKEYKERFDKSKSDKELEDLKIDSKKRAMFYAKIYNDTLSIIKSKEKADKKRIAMEVKQAQKEKEKMEAALRRCAEITVNIRINGENYTMTINNDATTGELRKMVIKLVQDLSKKTSGSKPKIPTSSMRLIHNNDTLTEHPRRTLGKWGVRDGSVILMTLGIAGGGKRASQKSDKSTFDEKVQEVKDEMMLSTMMLQIAPYPLTSEIATYLNGLKDKVLNSPLEFEKFLEDLPTENLMKLQSLCSTTNTDLKLSNMSKFVFGKVHGKMQENQKQLLACERMMKSLFTLMMLMSYSTDDTPSIQWTKFSKDLMNIISDKSHSEGMKDAKSGDASMK